MEDRMPIRRVELEGAVITYGGRLNKILWGDAIKQIRGGGGKISEQISAKLTCFVAGSGAGSKVTKARARGVPIINEAQLIELLTKGFVEWEEVDPFATKATFDECIAELRAIFNATPSSEGWTRCLEIVEGCDPERIEDLLSYATPFVAAWDGAEMGKWEPPDKHPLLTNIPKYWREGLPEDEVRAAPPCWLFEIIRGKHHPKHALARVLNLEGLKLNGSLGSNVLSNPHLHNLRVLNLGIQNTFSISFYKELRTSELMRTVCELWLYTDKELLLSAWDEPDHSFDALVQVKVDHWFGTQRMNKLPCLKGVPIHAMPKRGY
jgi:hypothetical protein